MVTVSNKVVQFSHALAILGGEVEVARRRRHHPQRFEICIAVDDSIPRHKVKNDKTDLALSPAWSASR